jgi:uncharacterized protein with PIN domain
MKKTERQRLINANDILFSLIVRLKGKRCKKCGKYGEPKQDGMMIDGLDCSHWHGRQNMILRYDEKNADCLCSGCHRYWWHGNKTETIARKEWEKRFPERDKYLLDKLKNQPMSFKADVYWIKKQNILLKDILNTLITK